MIIFYAKYDASRNLYANIIYHKKLYQQSTNAKIIIIMSTDNLRCYYIEYLTMCYKENT